MADKIATRKAYGDILVKLGSQNSDIVVLDADLSKSTMTAGFKKNYPDRFFNMGIAEQNMYGVAAGLALSGKTVFASTFAMFAAGRAYEIVRNSIGYTRANVKICATHAGITVGEDGGSHQAIEDIALMRVIPGMTVISPSDAVSAEKLIEQAAAIDGPFYIRLGRSGVPVIYNENNNEIKIGKATFLREGKDVTVIAAGIMVEKALEAAEILRGKGIDATVLDMHTIKPIDEKAVIDAAKNTGNIVVCEEHSVIGGLYGAVAEIVVNKAPCKMAAVAIEDKFGQSGKPDELLEKYGLTVENIVRKVEEVLS